MKQQLEKVKEVIIDSGADKMTVINDRGISFLTKKELLRACIVDALFITPREYLGVVMETERIGQEVVINVNDDFVDKMRYYQEAYTDNLTLKDHDTIKITRFATADTIKELMEKLGLNEK